MIKKIFFVLILVMVILPLSWGQQSEIMTGKIKLPEQVPYLNKRENYLIGNGFVCASGVGDGKWNFIAGPDYTCPNFISNEKITITINNVERPLIFDMYRARETGLYYGKTRIEDLEITLLDYTISGMPILSRLVVVENKSEFKNYSVKLNAYLTPISGNGRTATIVKNPERNTTAVSIHLDTSLYCMGNNVRDSLWVKNWDDRIMLTTWNDVRSDSEKNGDEFHISSATRNISGSKSESFNLCHYIHYGDKTDEECIRIIRSRNGTVDAGQCIKHWQEWFRNVPSDCSLAKIKDQRARDIVEGGLSVIKTNQTHDGGLVANENIYRLSWTRDAYCGLRGLLACGHTSESKQFIQFMNDVYRAYGFIPNAVSCGRNVFALYNGNFGNNPNRLVGGPCPESNTAPETPALLILAARDYYRATNDSKTLLKADESITYSMEIQLKHAIKNNYKLELSGDETELGFISSTGYDGVLKKYWSMSSIALCIASLEFYIEYVSLKKENPSLYKNSIDGKILDLNAELKRLSDALEKDFWRTDLAESPEGFYDWCRVKADNSFPEGRVVNFSLFPIYYKAKPAFPERFEKNLHTIKKYFIPSGKYLPLVPTRKDKTYLGHNLGYLLWSLVEFNETEKDIVYDALINGESVQCWGSYSEMYDANEMPDANYLRTFETGVNIDAIARYWHLGSRESFYRNNSEKER